MDIRNYFSISKRQQDKIKMVAIPPVVDDPDLAILDERFCGNGECSVTVRATGEIRLEAQGGVLPASLVVSILKGARND